MDKNFFTRPEVVVACLLLVWFSSAATYALVFTY
jgi:hypothetical protein